MTNVFLVKYHTDDVFDCPHCLQLAQWVWALPPWWERLYGGRWAASPQQASGRQCFHMRVQGPASTLSSSEGSSTVRDAGTHTSRKESGNRHTGWPQVKFNNSSLLSHLLSFSLCLNIVKWENVLGTSTVFSLPTTLWESRGSRNTCAIEPYHCTTRRPVLFLLYRGAHGAEGRTARFLHSCTISSASFSLIFSSFLIIRFPLKHTTLNPSAHSTASQVAFPHYSNSLAQSLLGGLPAGFTQINNDCEGITGKSEHNQINWTDFLSNPANFFLSVFYFSFHNDVHCIHVTWRKPQTYRNNLSTDSNGLMSGKCQILSICEGRNMHRDRTLGY